MTPIHRMVGLPRDVEGSGFVVIMKTQSGRPVTDLQQQDFKVLDTNSIRPI